MAGFARNVIRERKLVELAAARHRGPMVGRPRSPSPKQEALLEHQVYDSWEHLVAQTWRDYQPLVERLLEAP